MDISSTSSSSDEEIFFLLNEERRRKRRRRRQCRRYLAYIFFVVTYVCSARLFCVWAPQVVFYCNFSCSRHVSKSANLIGRIVFDAARQTKKTNPRRLKKKKNAFTRGAFPVGVHTHIGALCLVTRRKTSANISHEIHPGVYAPLVWYFPLTAKCYASRDHLCQAQQ